MTIFLRLLSEKDKASTLQEVSISVRNGGDDARVFELQPEAFIEVPGVPFAYWITPSTRSLFSRLCRFGSEGRTAQHGCSTKDDVRFVRLSWEIKNADNKWFPYAKGGSYSPFYQDIIYLINWAGDAKELEASLLKKFPYLGNNANWVLHRESFYFFPGIKWPLRASSFAPQVMPRGVIFSGRSYAAFADEADLLWLLALTNSSAFDYLFKILLGRFGFPEFLIGTIELVPFPEISSEKRRQLDSLSRKGWSLRRKLCSVNETSHAFLLPALVQANLYGYQPQSIEKCLATVKAGIDALSFELYKFDETDLSAMIQSTAMSESANIDNVTNKESSHAVHPADLETELLSWCVGITFGRFDWRLATGEREAPSEPDPFDALPTKSPGMLPDDAEPFHTRAGILVDDPGHPHDLAHLMEEVLERVEMPVPDNVRHWLQRDFFAFHLKTYSKSRRKAPIYWPLSTPSASYSVWCYYHRLTRDTFFRVANDYVTPKVDHEERKLNTLQQETGPDLSSKQRKDIDAQENFVAELRTFKTEVIRIAPLWNPNLNDGVIINFAPLWRIVPQNKKWQKECKKIWDKLVKGDYDWAHLAMHLWPERVVPKCSDDCSLAIAHGLEGDFWYEDDESKWKKRQVSDDLITKLVAERSSKAVKAALKDLLEAPAPTGGSTRKKRKARS